MLSQRKEYTVLVYPKKSMPLGAFSPSFFSFSFAAETPRRVPAPVLDEPMHSGVSHARVSRSANAVRIPRGTEPESLVDGASYVEGTKPTAPQATTEEGRR